MVFDVCYGFDVVVFVVFSGMLKVGSWLVLLFFVWEEWEN